MFTGSSAYLNEESRQFNTPKVRIQLTANEYLTRGSSEFLVSALGLSEYISYKRGVYHQGTLYTAADLGKFQGSGTSQVLYVFSQPLNSLGQGGSWSISNSINLLAEFAFDPSFYAPQELYSNGNSLYYFYGVSNTLYRQGLNGSVWGTSTTVFTGGSPKIISISSINQDRVYCLVDSQGTTPFSDNSRVNVLKVENNSGWGSTMVLQNTERSETYRNFQSFFASNIGSNLDILTYQLSEDVDQTSGTVEPTRQQLMSTSTDGVNSFGGYNNFESNAGSDINGYITKGLSLYFMFIIMALDSSRSSLGAANLNTNELLFYSTSNNCINWSSPIYLYDISNLNKASRNLSSLLPIGIPGVSNLQCIFLTTSTGVSPWGFNSFRFLKDNNTVDISTNIIDYNNSDNNSIDLKLGNFK